MGRYVTDYGTVIESDEPQKSWHPTTAPLTIDPGNDNETSFGDKAKTFGESALAGGIDAVMAVPRLVSAVNAKLGGSDPLAGATGRAAIDDTVRKTAGPIVAGHYDEEARARAEANPGSATLGTMAGQIGGTLATGGLAGGVGRAASGALGGGLAARLGGAAVTGALEGGQLGVAGAQDAAWMQRQQVDAEHALAAAGLGALLGGGLSFAAKGAGEVFGAGARAAKGAISRFTAPAEEVAVADVAAAPLEAPVASGATEGPGKARYARGLRDIEGAVPETELPLGGRRGAGIEGPEELRGALNAEDLNSRNRTAKIDKLLDIVPEGAHPDWVLNMTPTQRRAMADFVGVPEASDVTWKALADAVGEREGVTASQPVAASAMAEPTAVAATGPDATPASKGAYKAWNDMLKQAATWALKKGAGKMVGTVLGGTHGPVGAFVGHQVGNFVDQAVERLAASGALDAMAQRSARVAGRALDGALALGRGIEPVARLGVAGARQGAIATFLGSHETPEDAFRARATELADLGAPDGQAIRDKVQESFGPLAQDHPGAVLGAQQVASAGVQYLLSKLPQAGPNYNSFTPRSDSRVPERTDINAFGRIYGAVMKPQTVLTDIARGRVTTPQLDAVRTVYPQWYQQNVVALLGSKLARRDARGERLTSSQRTAVSMLTGTRTGIDASHVAEQFGPIFAEQDIGDKASRPLGGGGSSRYSESYSSSTTNDLLKGYS